MLLRCSGDRCDEDKPDSNDYLWETSWFHQADLHVRLRYLTVGPSLLTLISVKFVLALEVQAYSARVSGFRLFLGRPSLELPVA